VILWFVPDEKGKKERDNNSLDLKEGGRWLFAFPYTLGIAEVSCSVSPIGRASPSGDAAQIENWALTGAGIVTDWPRG
jgi:hypothetical protein